MQGGCFFVTYSRRVQLSHTFNLSSFVTNCCKGVVERHQRHNNAKRITILEREYLILNQSEGSLYNLLRDKRSQTEVVEEGKLKADYFLFGYHNHDNMIIAVA